MLDKFLNHLWLLFHLRQGRDFKRKVIAAGYDTNDIWFNRHMGFICLPPDGDIVKDGP